MNDKTSVGVCLNAIQSTDFTIAVSTLTFFMCFLAGGATKNTTGIYIAVRTAKLVYTVLCFMAYPLFQSLQFSDDWHFEEGSSTCKDLRNDISNTFGIRRHGRFSVVMCR